MNTALASAVQNPVAELAGRFGDDQARGVGYHVTGCFGRSMVSGTLLRITPVGIDYRLLIVREDGNMKVVYASDLVPSSFRATPFQIFNPVALDPCS